MRMNFTAQDHTLEKPEPDLPANSGSTELSVATHYFWILPFPAERSCAL